MKDDTINFENILNDYNDKIDSAWKCEKKNSDCVMFYKVERDDKKGVSYVKAKCSSI